MSAFEDVERLPVFVGSRDALLHAARGDGHASPAAIAAAIESDPALCGSVMRLANARQSGVGTVPDALDHVSLEEVRELASSAHTFDVLGGVGLWGSHPERFRLHAVAVQHMALRIARETHHPAPDRLVVAALFHDIGKLVLLTGYPGATGILGSDAAPEERVRLELRTFGLTHTMAGGVLARRWRLPAPIERVIVSHHDDDCGPDAAVVRLADLLVHHVHDAPVSPRAVFSAAGAAGLRREGLRRLAGDPGRVEGPRAEASPLSRRELEALRGLSRGKVYKEIAEDLGLAVSTVRSHLSRTYEKLGARDRAQAVLIASERGWI